MPFPILEQQHERYVPYLLSMLKQAPEDLKQEVSLLLATLVYYIPKQSLKQKTIDKIIQTFVQSRSSSARKAFVEFCLQAMTVTS